MEEAVLSLLARHETVFVKLDRSSNGYGSFSVTQDDLDRLPELLNSFHQAIRGQPECFTIEEMLHFQSLPSVEMTVCYEDIRLGYICDHRDGRTGGPATGMQTLPGRLPQEAIRELEAIGRGFGTYLQKLGYRGV